MRRQRIDLSDKNNKVKEDEVSEEGASTSEPSCKQKKSKEEMNAHFRYGNYNRYYGMRTKGFERDPRLELMDIDWFKGKAVLDIGCNVGFLTLAIAKDFQPSHILGIDIDDKLVGVARKNIRHYCGEGVELVGKYPAIYPAENQRSKQFATTGRIRFTDNDDGKEEEKKEPGSSEKPSAFPDNVWFLRENYVLEADEDIDMVREEYDVILALSITKWIHLNWGDEGLKRFFRRAFRQLLPGGRLILEIQPYSTYGKKSRLMDELKQNYQKITFKPDEFAEYLLSPEVGFEKQEELGVPKANSKGFERPLLCFRKKVYKPVGFDAVKKERVFVKAKRLIRKEEEVEESGVNKDEEMPENVEVVSTQKDSMT